MTTITNAIGTGAVTPDYTSNLSAWWPCFDITGSSLVDASGNGYDLTPYTGNMAGIDSAHPGRAQWDTATCQAGTGDTSALELIGANTSFLLSMRVNMSADYDGGAGYVLAKIDNSRDDGWGVYVGGTSGIPYVRAISAGNRLGMTTDLRDSADHHIAWYIDRGTDTQEVYLDGSDDTNAGSTTTPVPAYTASGADGDFSFGGGGKSGSIVSGLAGLTASVGTDAFQLFDVQLYLVSGSLPSNLTTVLIPWLSKNIYKPIPASMW